MRPDAPARTIRDTMLATKREVLLARLLLRVCDALALEDADQEFIELYNSIKPIAEALVRPDRDGVS